LLNTSDLKLMKFLVHDIQFDFIDSEGELPNDEQVALIKDVLEEPWEAVDEEDLIDEITSFTGWCINSIDYSNISNS
jgi:hypothetical protein